MGLTDKKVVVSVRCITFNHARFIRQCLDSLVMQVTDFRYQIVILDDASTDNTQDIILEYSHQYPNLIIPILLQENHYSIKKDRAHYIKEQEDKVDAEYIAMCEGDDYWTDPLKLQKQVDYMESHPDCMMCFGNAIEHWEDGRRPDKSFSSLEDRDYTGQEICWKWMVPTASIIYRKSILNTELCFRYKSNQRLIVGDLPLFVTCASYGKIHAFSDVFSVYRKQDSGFTRNFNSTRSYQMGLMWKEFPKIFGQEYSEVSTFKAILHFRNGMYKSKRERNYQMYWMLFFRVLQMYLLHPIDAGKRARTVLRERKAAKTVA